MIALETDTLGFLDNGPRKKLTRQSSSDIIGFKGIRMNKTPVVLLLCLSMGCSTTRSAAGGYSLASGIATGIGTIVLTGVAASNGSSGGSVLPMVGSISMGALLSTTFLTLAGYLLGNEGNKGISASTARWWRAADQTVGITRDEAEEAARIARTETARSSAIRLCRQTPNGVVTPRFSTTTVRCINGVPHH